MKTEVGKFTFTVPEGHPEQGKKIPTAFNYQVCENEAEATATISERKWDILEMANDKLRTNARSSAYQSALLPYKPLSDNVTPEDIRERMIRDYIRLGVAQDVARQLVEAALNASKAVNA